MAHPAIDLAGVAIALSACVGTCVAAFVNWQTLRSILEPEIVLYPDINERAPALIQLVIHNVGKGGAYNIRFYPERPIPSRRTGQRIERGPFESGINYLPAGGKRVIDWGVFHILDTPMATPIKVRMEYFQKKFSGGFSLLTNTSELEVRSFEGTTAARRALPIDLYSEDLSKVAAMLEAIAKKRS